MSAWQTIARKIKPIRITTQGIPLQRPKLRSISQRHRHRMKGSRIANRLELRRSTEPVRESQHELERSSRPVMKRTAAMTPSPVFQLDHQSGSIGEAQPKRRRKGRKSMSRRSGQNGTIIIAGNWYRVRRLAAHRDLGMFLLTAIGWTRTSLGKSTQTIWPPFFPVNSNLRWTISPSGSF